MTPGDGGLETEVETKKPCPPSTRLYHHWPPAERSAEIDCRFNRSTQHRLEIVLPARHSLASCEAVRSVLLPRGSIGPDCEPTDPCLGGNTVVASDWCSRWIHAARDSADRRSTLRCRLPS